MREEQKVGSLAEFFWCNKHQRFQGFAYDKWSGFTKGGNGHMCQAQLAFFAGLAQPTTKQTYNVNNRGGELLKYKS